MAMRQRKTRVLVIDDEVTFTELFKLNLEDRGAYEVQVENLGGVGVAAAREFRPDIIFLDVIMPDMDGTRVATQIRTDRDPALRQIPIVYVTAILSRQRIHEPLTPMGGVAVLAKPVSTEEIVACIEQFTGNGHASRSPAAGGGGR